MKVLQVYNEQRSRFGGEPAVVEVTMRVLAEHGHEARLFMKSSRELERSAAKRFAAFWGGVYNLRARREMRRLLAEFTPDVVHIHSLYPMFSPSILSACREAGVPAVMTVHSHNLTCPTWYHLYKGRVCEECVGGREYRCLVKNCRNNVLESAAYALRSGVARRFRLLHDGLDMLIALTPFAKSRLAMAGFREDRIAVAPNPSAAPAMPGARSEGGYIAFAGRMSAEKGVDVLLAAAALMPGVLFKAAGDGPLLPALKRRAPANVEFLGTLAFDGLVELYRGARALAVPSVWFEQFPMVIADAMTLGTPVAASRIGGLPDIVEDGATGLLFEPGDAAALAEKLRMLWDNPHMARRMGEAGREKALRHYTREAYYKNLLPVYRAAMARTGLHAELVTIGG
ncbi:MAG TPA: glycosyltransferase family 4 protein [Bryobacteraceae bacterium]|nr:glycosyltransferase family 4 protein [Bryobacteraceae bacterium]